MSLGMANGLEDEIMGEQIKEYAKREVQFGREVPDPIPPGEIFVFVENGVVQSVDFLCPCGCGVSCYTPVVVEGQPKHSRQWIYSEKDGKVTLSPSIKFTGGCKSHFNITEGRGEIHGDSGK